MSLVPGYQEVGYVRGAGAKYVPRNVLFTCISVVAECPWHCLTTFWDCPMIPGTNRTVHMDVLSGYMYIRVHSGIVPCFPTIPESTRISKCQRCYMHGANKYVLRNVHGSPVSICISVVARCSTFRDCPFLSQDTRE